MTTNQKKNISRETISSKLSRFPVWFQLVISFLFEYSLNFIGAAIVLFILMIFLGDVFSIQGLILALIILGFLLLRILNKWIDEH